MENNDLISEPGGKQREGPVVSLIMLMSAIMVIPAHPHAILEIIWWETKYIIGALYKWNYWTL